MKSGITSAMIMMLMNGPKEAMPETPKLSSSAFLPPLAWATPMPRAKMKGADTAPVVVPTPSATTGNTESSLAKIPNPNTIMKIRNTNIR